MLAAGIDSHISGRFEILKVRIIKNNMKCLSSLIDHPYSLLAARPKESCRFSVEHVRASNQNLCRSKTCQMGFIPVAYMYYTFA